MTDPGDPRPPRPIRPLPVLGGIVLGLVSASLVQTFLFILLSGLPVFAASPAPMYAIYLVPGLVGTGLLLSPRTRQAGAGLLLGLAVGAIVLAGACAVLTAAILAGTS